MALLKVLLLLLLGLGISVNSDVSLQKRIIGGQNCDNTEHLYYVRLESSNGTHSQRCGGSLIHPQWILTVSHCYKSEPGWTNRAFLKVHPRTVIQYSQIIRQEPLIYILNLRAHDIMLLKLQTPVTDVPFAQLPVCRRHLKKGDVFQLAGEGATTKGPNNKRITNAAIPAHLQCVDMRVSHVSQLHPGIGHIFHAKAPNKDICYGDAGGAAMHNNMIYGVILSGGEDACKSPVGILDVCEYKAWIRRKIQ